MEINIVIIGVWTTGVWMEISDWMEL